MSDSQETVAPVPPASSLARVQLDALLQEVLQRVGTVLRTEERLRELLDAVVAIASDLSVDRVLERIIEAAATLVDAKYVALGVIAPGGDRRLQQFITHGLSAEERAAIGDLPSGHGILGHLIDHPETLRLVDIQAHADSYGFPPNHPPMHTFLGSPIRIRDKVFGNLYLTEKRGGGDFTKEDEEIVVALAAAAGVVIENARLYEEAARREAWLTAAAEITTALLGPIDQADALQLVADRARLVAGADVAMILTRSGDDLTIQVVSGSDSHPLVGRIVEGDQSLAGAAMVSDSIMMIDDVASSKDAYQALDLPDDWPNIGPAMLIPLRTADRVEGVLIIGWARTNEIASREIDPQLPVAFAEQAALAMRVARAQADQAMLAVLEDRDRIGRDLHDVVIQRLFAIGLSLDNTARLAGRPEAAGRIHAAVDDIDATIKEIRRTIFELSSPDESDDLRRQIATILQEAAAPLGFVPTLETNRPVDSLVTHELRKNLIAVITEAVSNAARHASCTELSVVINVGDHVELLVEDDGRGFDHTELERVSGLRNMKERAERLGGSFAIESAATRGTKLRWSVPSTRGN
jgi:signal transduction histidine kinase